MEPHYTIESVWPKKSPLALLWPGSLGFEDDIGRVVWPRRKREDDGPPIANAPGARTSEGVAKVQSLAAIGCLKDSLTADERQHLHAKICQTRAWQMHSRVRLVADLFAAGAVDV